MTKAIKISDENYRWLSKVAGFLQQEKLRPISLDEALTYLHKNQKLSDLAGSWNMSDKEEKEMFATLSKGWKGWKIKSV